MSGHLALGSHHIAFGFEIEKKGKTPPWVKQVHGVDWIRANTQIASGEPMAADAVVTDRIGAEIYVYTADCIPVFLASHQSGTRPAMVAAIHSGWRGTMKGIVPNVLKVWPAPLEETRVIIGPALGNCHFEVRQDFIDEFTAVHPDIDSFLEKRDGKIFFRHFDFVCDRQLAEIDESQIDRSSAICTYCSKPELPSFRRNKSTDPQIRAWIRIEHSH
jgi:polyphenol oxidase